MSDQVPPDKVLFNRVRELREHLRLTQEKLGDQLGITRQTVISIENGRYNPSLGLALRIARFFHRHIEEIFSDDGFYPTLIAIPATAVPDAAVSAPVEEKAL